MTPDQRRAPDNGIWLCQDHSKALDSNDPEFTVEICADGSSKHRGIHSVASCAMGMQAQTSPNGHPMKT